MENGLFAEKIKEKVKNLVKEVEAIGGEEEKIEIINEIKKQLHEISPFRNEPVDCIEWIKEEKIIANDYNPNNVAPPEMKLLEISIDEDGYTQPIVTYLREGIHEVVDGFHRTRVGKECKRIYKRIKGYLPIVCINENRIDKGDRIASTIRHNRARGKHQISAMSDIVVDLKKRNWSEEKIGRELGMEPDEVLRLVQITGLTEMFKDKEFSEAWEINKINDNDNLNTSKEN
jgi:ParB-like chromosome segregation protein Spo0J